MGLPAASEASGARRATLNVDAEHQGAAYVIRLRGELDFRSCRFLRLALQKADRTEAERIVLDLEELSSIDANGLATLLAASRQSANNGNRLSLTRGRGFLADMFRLTGLDMTLPLIDPALCPAISADRR